tara:strand:+ start:33 stop:308 length:276 start_codon:yes stop_codon:yes gene_type:complete
LLSKNDKLIPGQALIYERANGVVYAKYRDPPHNLIPRWIIGGDPGSVARAQGRLLDYSEWQQLCEVACENKTLKKLLDKLVTTYYIIKENK